MTEAELRKLRSYYRSLQNMQNVLEQERSPDKWTTAKPTGQTVVDELERLAADFPGLVPPFNAQEWLFDWGAGRTDYRISSLLAHTGLVLGRLSVDLDSAESTPVTETRQFFFIQNPKLRRILERDYIEVQRAFLTQAWKSVIILSGGAVETILLDLVQRDEAQAKASAKAPKRQPDVTRWDLNELIEVCVDLKLVSPGVGKLSGPVREYRNLIHPGNEVRTGLIFDAEEARIALEVLNIVHRDLSR